MNNKNAVYVLNQPKHMILTVINVSDIYPKSEDIHETIDKLQEISDIMFVFREDCEKYINPKKFASLYQACGFIISGGNLDKTVLESLYYSKEIFSKHSTYLLTNESGMSNIGDLNKLLNNIVQLNMSIIQRPVFKIYRMSDEQLYEYYKISDSSKFTRVIDTNDFWYFRLWNLVKYTFSKKEPEFLNMFTTHNTDSGFIFIRAATIGSFLDKYGAGDSGIMNFVDSFQTNLYPGAMFASYFRQQGIQILNEDIENLKINDIVNSKS